MHHKRFNLPPLDLIQGFEAAARTLSFTKAGEELSITQSAVSRQIRALEDHLGVALFERRPRSLTLTEQGQTLYRAAAELLERLQETTNRLRSDAAAPHLTVTTTGGFASLWLIPRLRTFTALHPDVDVRISATYAAVNLERSLVDIAVRYCKAEEAPEGAIRLFGEELFPVCSPALLMEGPHPLRTLKDLRNHALLHMEMHMEVDGAKNYMDWDTWLAAQGYSSLKPAASIRFDSYEQMIQAAVGGQGVAMGIGRLVSGLVASGQLAAPFCASTIGSRAYFIIRSALTGDRPHVRAFVDWLMAQARTAQAAEAEVPMSAPATNGRSQAQAIRAAVSRSVPNGGR